MLLVHTCCADCALKFFNSLKSEEIGIFERVNWFYYNPNIHPKTEYLARMRALKKVIKQLKNKHGWQGELIIPNYRPVEYFQAIGKLGRSPQKPQRCQLCWQLRLKKVCEYAQENQYQAVGTTLITSHYQDSQFINQLSKSLSEKFNVEYFVPAEIESNLQTGGFYKQNYCGCTYSLTERLEEKFV